MKGVKQQLQFSGSPTEFFEKIQLLKPIGGGFCYYPDGKGIFIEPDLSEKMALRIEKMEIIYS